MTTTEAVRPLPFSTDTDWYLRLTAPQRRVINPILAEWANLSQFRRDALRVAGVAGLAALTGGLTAAPVFFAGYSLVKSLKERDFVQIAADMAREDPGLVQAVQGAVNEYLAKQKSEEATA